MVDFEQDLANFSKFDRVAEQVCQNLAQAQLVTNQAFWNTWSNPRDQLQPFAVSTNTEGGYGLVDQIGQVEFRLLDLHTPALDLGQVKNTID